MGSCVCKEAVEDVYRRWASDNPRTRSRSYYRKSVVKVVDPNVIDQLVLELLSLIASYVDIDDESPVSLVKLHLIADKEEGWFQVVNSLVNSIPLEDPLGPSTITIVFDDCPLPARSSVIKLTRLYGLSAERARTVKIDLQPERNLCVVLGCIAEKLAGPNSAAILTDETIEYMVTFLIIRRNPCVVLFGLIAIEKFSNTTENKERIMARLAKEKENPLLILEQHAASDDCGWRQVGFCAKWALDNIFVMSERPLSNELVDMTCINAMLNCQDVSEYLKISCDGLEARCDSYSFESVRCTYQLNAGTWYYECLIVTPGVMQIGWATKNSHFLNHEGYGIGDDLHSVSYDGCRRLIWHEAKPAPVYEVPAWQPGDIVGCLLDIDRREAVFSLNGVRIRSCSAIFETTRQGFFAGASFMAFQQCRFNFGYERFRFPPKNRRFRCFNDYGFLTDEQKKVVPRRVYLEQVRLDDDDEDCCRVCYDHKACCTLEPCMHSGFCPYCTPHLGECPLCRAKVVNIRQET